MAVQMSTEQFQQLISQLKNCQTTSARHFTQCTARFDGTRTKAAVDEFITAATIFKTVEGVNDLDALEGLPLLLTGEANQWWSGVRNNITTWESAMKLIREAFAPQRPNYRLFLEIFGKKQKDDMPTDKYITQQRDLFSQMNGVLPEKWQIDIVFGLLRHYIRDRISRTDISTFADLLTRARAIEENEREKASVRHYNDQSVPSFKTSTSVRVKCEFCHNYGHESTVCREQMKWNQEEISSNPATNQAETSTSSNLRCYGCQKPGIYRRNCPDCNGISAPTFKTTSSFCSMGAKVIKPRPRPVLNMEIGGAAGTDFIEPQATVFKQQITTTAVLQTADPIKPFILRTYRNGFALGAALLQGEGTAERPEEQARRLLTTTENNYSTTERVALAIVCFVNRFRGYMEESPTIIITDLQPLKWLMSLTLLSHPEANLGVRNTQLVIQLGDEPHPLSNAPKGFSSKFAPKRNGSYVILRAYGVTTYEIADKKNPDVSLGTYHSSQLMPYFGPTDETPSSVTPLRKRGRPRKTNFQDQ